MLGNFNWNSPAMNAKDEKPLLSVKLPSELRFSGIEGKGASWRVFSSNFRTFISAYSSEHHLIAPDDVPVPGNAGPPGANHAQARNELQKLRASNRLQVYRLLKAALTDDAQNFVVDDGARFEGRPATCFAELGDEFEKISAAKIVDLRAKYATVRMAKTDDLAKVIVKLDAIYYELSDQGQKPTDIERRQALLRALVQPDWHPIVKKMMRNNALGYHETVRLLREDENSALMLKREADLSTEGVSVEPAALSIQDPNAINYALFLQWVAQKENANPNTLPQARNTAITRPDVGCLWCGRKNHLIAECKVKMAGKPRTSDGEKANAIWVDFRRRIKAVKPYSLLPSLPISSSSTIANYYNLPSTITGSENANLSNQIIEEEDDLLYDEIRENNTKRSKRSNHTYKRRRKEARREKANIRNDKNTREVTLSIDKASDPDTMKGPNQQSCADKLCLATNRETESSLVGTPTNEIGNESSKVLSEENEKILDSGTKPSHVRSTENLKEVLPCKRSTTVAGNTEIPITGIGTLCLSNCPPITGVNLVPTLKNDLISVSQISQQWNCSTLFDDEKAIIFKGKMDVPKEKIIKRGTLKKGLYILNTDKITSDALYDIEEIPDKQRKKRMKRKEYEYAKKLKIKEEIREKREEKKRLKEKRNLEEIEKENLSLFKKLSKQQKRLFPGS